MIEPLPIESFFQAFRLVEDETVVRANAQFAIKRAVEQRTFAVTSESGYVRRELFEGFEQFVKRVSVAHLSRERVICERKAKIKATFLDSADRNDTKNFILEQPFRAFVLAQRTMH